MHPNMSKHVQKDSKTSEREEKGAHLKSHETQLEVNAICLIAPRALAVTTERTRDREATERQRDARERQRRTYAQRSDAERESPTTPRTHAPDKEVRRGSFRKRYGDGCVRRFAPRGLVGRGLVRCLWFWLGWL